MRLYGELKRRHVEQGRQLAAIGQLVAGLAELVEEAVRARLERREPRRGIVLEEPDDQVDGFGRSARTEHFVPGMRANLRELELLVVGIHLADLVSSGRAEHFDDLNELVDARFAREERLAEQELGEDAAG